MADDYRLLITGSRDLGEDGRRLLLDRLHLHLGHAKAWQRRLILVQGRCSTGADQEARAWALQMQLDGEPVEAEDHPAKNHPTQDFGEWPACGPRRNRHMVRLGAAHCEALIDVCTSGRCRIPAPHGSHGASGCAQLAEDAGIPTTKWELWKT